MEHIVTNFLIKKSKHLFRHLADQFIYSLTLIKLTTPYLFKFDFKYLFINDF